MENFYVVVEDTDKGKKVICPESFDISTVSEVKNIFEKILQDAPTDIKLSTEITQTIDTSALQLLVSFIQSAAKQGIRLEITTPSEAVSQAAMVLGLNEVLSFQH